MTTTTTTNPFFPSLAMLVWGAPGRAQYVGRPRFWVEADAAERWTPASYFQATDLRIGEYPIIVSVRGTFTGTVTLQRSTDDGVTWQDVEQYTSPTEEHVVNPEQSLKYRIGIKAGDYTSGKADCILSQ